MNIKEVLGKVPLFSSLSGEDLSKIISLFSDKTYSKKEHVFFESEPGRDFYIVRSGRIKIYKMSSGGQVKTLEYLETGDFFGEMALLESSPRSANAVAVSDSEVLVLRFDDFQSLLSEHPGILLALARALCGRLRKADREIELFSFKGVRDRLILCLINLASRYGIDKPEGAVFLPGEFTHQDLSELAGTAREVVTRTMKELRDEELIIKEPGGMTIPSVSALRRKIAE